MPTRRAVALALATAPLAGTAAASTPAEPIASLWQRYLEQYAIACAAHEAADVAHAQVDRELPDPHWWPDQKAKWEAVSERLGYSRLADAWNVEFERLAAIIEAIRNTQATDLFSLGVKLAALREEADESDVCEAVADVLGNIDRALGSDFAKRFAAVIEQAGV